MIKTLLWDIDGTLLDFSKSEEYGIRKCFDVFGLGECTDEMLSLIDILVDGRFILAQKNIRLRFRGSENQRIIDLPKTLKSSQIVLWDK